MSSLKDLARAGRNYVERLRYRGTAVTCNVCDAQARSWNHGRANGRCPTCRCATRTRVLWWYLTKRIAEPGTLRVLHFAPEPPLEARVARWGVKQYDTCDLRNPKVTHQVDIQKLPFADASYDLVLCSHVLEHIPDDRAAMRELRRITSPGGRTLIMLPLAVDMNTPTREDLSPTLSPEERKRQFGEIDHLREYGLDVQGMLAGAGFTVTRFDAAAEIPPADQALYGLGSEQQIFICTP